jgi:maltose alpha-D-glucosyltransferase/alpha-amylase
VAGEQSNSSVIYGDRAIFKLFRKLEPGINPDVEVTRFLTTRTSFRDTPELLAELGFESELQGRSVAGMLTRFVAGAEDGWRYALGQLRSYLGAGGNGGDPSNIFADDARVLGRITREMHRALASVTDDPAFATEPVTGTDIARWTERTMRTVDSALDLLASRASSLEPRTAAMSRAIAGRRVSIHELVDEASRGARGERAVDQGIKSRTHGDYHLGQLLHASDGRWYVIDFEGEPARPMVERRELTSPARDVAGMLRSFGYAAAAGALEAGGLGTNPATEIRSAHWDRDARAAFLDAYGADPNDPLIELFEMEKMFYELEYELNNRPDWVWVPLRAIARLF